eukprot:10341300-Alexandrium_andersonii.AAC.1
MSDVGVAKEDAVAFATDHDIAQRDAAKDLGRKRRRARLPWDSAPSPTCAATREATQSSVAGCPVGIELG